MTDTDEQFEGATVRRRANVYYAGRVTIPELPDGSEVTVEAGESFSVPADSEFDIAADEAVDYCCQYD